MTFAVVGWDGSAPKCQKVKVPDDAGLLLSPFLLPLLCHLLFYQCATVLFIEITVRLVQQPNARASSRLLCKSVSETLYRILGFENRQCCVPNSSNQYSDFIADRMNYNAFYKCEKSKFVKHFSI